MRRQLMVAATATLGLSGLVIGITPAAAAGHDTIIVRPGHSIQAAIDEARPGDTVLVEPGTYHQSLQITTSGITLRGAGGDDRNAVLVPPATPPSNLCTQVNGAASGICVVGSVDSNGNVVHYVHNVTISGFTIKSFPANGVFGYGTNGLRVRNVSAFNDGSYGIARFASTETTLTDNSTAGNAEAGLYIGDSPDADTLVAGNQSWNNGLGIFVRHAHQVTMIDNQMWANCVGILVLDDGQPGGAGHVRIADNNSSGNNRACPGHDGSPPLSGGGIVLIGAVQAVVADNAVDGNNRGGSPASGGIVIASSKQGGGTGTDPTDDIIRNNEAFGNAPADVIWDGTGHGNRFRDNDCGKSVPGGLCS